MKKAIDKPVVKDLALYLGDNGRTLCGKHLGMMARYTGLDLSGQAIQEVTPAVVADARAYAGTSDFLRCETCGLGPREWEGECGWCDAGSPAKEVKGA